MGANMPLSEDFKTRVQRRTVLTAAVLLLGAGGGGCALAGDGPVDLVVVDRDTGQTLPIWSHHGREFVAGETGARYSLRVTNHTAGRVLVVMSVDGVNIITGQTAGYGQSGYVLDPYESSDVTGWRKSDAEVAAFAFAPLPQSYAARTGRPGDVGVIGMAVFKERSFLRPLAVGPRVAPSPAPLAAPPPPGAEGSTVNETVVTGSRLARRDSKSEGQGEKLGTAHGAREWSAVRTVAFARATPYPQWVRQIEYDSYDNLVARGVIPHGQGDGRRPRAFPSQPYGEGYVPDPPDDR